MYKTILKTCFTVVLMASAAAQAAPVVFDRGLPVTNLNNGAGASRSNVAWGFGESTPAYYSGDNFTLGAGNWNVSTVRVWAIIGATSDTSPSLIADRFSSISLYTGDGATLTNRLSGNTVGNSTDNADISITKVNYSSGANYDSFGTMVNIFEIDFNNLNWLITGGVTQNFSVAGVDKPGDQTFRPFFMHASNAALGGATADGADGKYAAYYQDGVNLTFDGLIDSGLPGNGWDKSSDINVQVEASAVPEPTSIALFAVALAGFGIARRQRGVKR